MKIHNFFILTVCLRNSTYRPCRLARLEKIVSGSSDILFPPRPLKIKQQITVIKSIKYEKKKVPLHFRMVLLTILYRIFNNKSNYLKLL